MSAPTLEDLARIETERNVDLSALKGRAVGAPRADDEGPTRAELLRDLLTPWTDEELDAAIEPHPHVFRSHERGLFPVGEVTVVGARGREGKTTVMVGIATAIAIEHSLAGLWPMIGRSVVVYSAEDDRAQYARKVAAQRAVLAPSEADQLKRRVFVPDLDQPGLEALRTLVTVADRQPIPTGIDTAIVEAMTPLMKGACPPALVVFETASTLADTDEDNRAWRLLIASLKRVARGLDVAVALVHHTSQAADATLADLTISTNNIRGGTALVYNSRQNLLLINLGSEDDPFPDTDARTVLRNMVAPGCPERITGLVAMDTSKANDPPPTWFRWVKTEYGPAAVEQDPPNHLIGRSWRKVREMAMAERGTRKAEAKESARSVVVDTVVRLVGELHASGKQPTARAVSIAAGKSPTWAAPYLGQAAIDGLVRHGMEKVPRLKNQAMVYRPLDPTEGNACTVE